MDKLSPASRFKEHMDRETECAQQWLYKKDIAFITVFGLQKQLDENIKLPNFADALAAILAEFRALKEKSNGS